MFTALFTYALLATAAFARPNVKDRVARRREGRQSQPLNHIESTAVGSSNISNVQYSSNWAGAVLIATSATYKTVTGTFVVPTPSVPSGGSSSTAYSASAWVGIDGDTCDTAILQTGVDFTIQSGKVSYDAWYEWYPDYAYDFSGITISAGNTIKLTVTATSTKAGSAVIENVSTGVTVTKALTSTAALCETNAEWIVEDYEEGSSLVPLADWGTVTFTGASASGVGPSGATIIDIEQNSKVLSSVSVSSSSVTVSYV